MKCREFTEFIADYLAGECPPDIAERFERHIGRCENCRRYLESYEESVKLGKAAFDASDEPVPEDVPDDLVKAVLAARRATAD